MSDLTKDERAWLRKIQKLLDNPPSDRMGFYTIGDPDVTVYDKTNQNSFSTDVDFGDAVRQAAANFDVTLRFPSDVHSTSG